MQRHQRQLRFTALRQAFTLVEMLIVGAIIVILVALTLVVTSKTAASAKETKTRATIQKIDLAMQQIFETFEIKFAAVKRRVDEDYVLLSTEDRQTLATHFIRDLMRMEMPQSWAEVYDSTNTNAPPLGPLTAKIDNKFYSDLASGPLDADPYPTQWTADRYGEYPLLKYYWMEYEKWRNVDSSNRTGKAPSRAALLFLIIQNLNPEALEAFHGSEVVQNEDGMLEFVDAWGNPIHFLRWAPAFPGSDLQPDVLARAGYVPEADIDANINWWTAMDVPLQKAMEAARDVHADPMDERDDAVGWFLYPLIYSAGPDGVYNLYVGEYDSDDEPVSPDSPEPFLTPFGMPGTVNKGGHFDNIHNHRWYNSF